MADSLEELRSREGVSRQGPVPAAQGGAGRAPAGGGECGAPTGPAEEMKPLWSRYRTHAWGTTGKDRATEQQEEISTLEYYIHEFLNGRLDEDKFKPMRLYMGIYGQRQGGTNQMVRIKIPFGRLTADTLDRIAGCAERYTPRRMAHVTTRQDLQLHFVKLQDVPALLRELARGGATTREACGNTVRNVTGCHRLGVCPSEPFDLTPYADAVSAFFLRNPDCQNLPRKFKIAFSGCPNDCAAGSIHDIGVFAQVREEGGRTTCGFRLLVGGGLGAAPRSARLFADFLPKELLLPTMRAIVRVFNRTGNRKNRYRARMKFVLQTLGWERFVQEVQKEREAVLREALPDLPDPVPNPLHGSEAKAESVTRGLPAGVMDRDWFENACEPQQQPGRYLVNLFLYRGDVTTAQMRGLAALLRRHSEIELRLTFQQNMALRNVSEGKLAAVHAHLAALGLASAAAETSADVTVCPGADTCNLAKTHSMALGAFLADRMKSGAAVNGYRIKISGCENSCGQHHIADLGFYGCIRKVGGRIVPHYVIMIGGSVSQDGATIGREVLKIPSRRIGEAVERLADLYLKEKAAGESFGAYLRRVDRDRVRAALKDLAQLPPYEEAPDLYRDLGEEQEYEFVERAGECAA
ncbi:MAG: nitrite/sulfite reductase [Nitrospirae bacterium]|nr:nitrite/sulfite reductase [Nitrospirota bacterium]